MACWDGDLLAFNWLPQTIESVLSTGTNFTNDKSRMFGSCSGLQNTVAFCTQNSTTIVFHVSGKSRRQKWKRLKPKLKRSAENLCPPSLRWSRGNISKLDLKLNKNKNFGRNALSASFFPYLRFGVQTSGGKFVQDEVGFDANKEVGLKYQWLI